MNLIKPDAAPAQRRFPINEGAESQLVLDLGQPLLFAGAAWTERLGRNFGQAQIPAQNGGPNFRLYAYNRGPVKSRIVGAGGFAVRIPAAAAARYKKKENRSVS